MADIIGLTITNTVLTGGGASRLQVFGQFSASQSFLVADFELTGANAQALAAGLATATVAAAATTGQVTTVTLPGAPAPLPGMYNTI